MRRIRYSTDIQSVSEFREKMNQMITQVKETKRPIVLTQNGKGTAVLMDVASYDEILERMEIAEMIAKSEQQIKEGKVISHEKAMAKINKSLL